MEVPAPLLHIFKTVTLDQWLEIVAVIASTVFLIIFLERLLPWLANKCVGRRRLFLLSAVPVLRVGLIVLALLYVGPRLIEPSIHNIVAIFGTAGLAVGFALKDYVSSVTAGIAVMNEMVYRPGDWIEIDGVYGEVTHIGTRTVTLVTADDTAVFMPHGKLWNTAVHNANNGASTLMCVVDYYLQPDHDAKRVTQILQDVALTSPYLQLSRPVTVTVKETPWGTHYCIKAYPIELRQQFRFSTDLTVRGKEALLHDGFELAVSPALTRIFHNGGVKQH